MSRFDLPRRQFLKLGSLTTLGVLAGTFHPRVLQAMPLDSRDPGSEPLLSVGYAEQEPETGQSVPLKAGSSMLDGDPTFLSRGARLTFQPLMRASQYSGLLAGGAAIDVVFPVNGYTMEARPRFRACSFVCDQAGDVQSGRVAFDLPVSATDGVQLVVRRMNPAVAETASTIPYGSARPGESSAPLLLGFGSRYAKLRRGVYAIALRETANDAVPRWSSARLTERDGSLLVTPAPFTYVVMKIDYAQ